MSNSVGRNNNFLAKARKLSKKVLPTSLDILIYGNTIYVFSIYHAIFNTMSIISSYLFRYSCVYYASLALVRALGFLMQRRPL